ncbi:hypothetical protein MN202_16190 [Rheinheimera muenzenbergensis]|uniref:Uncharacterized protein n=1 Tax=Rheinheimera muenzenbergensis TaxID=1193628 RepID=A0ABU8CA46_9GAMM
MAYVFQRKEKSRAQYQQNSIKVAKKAFSDNLEPATAKLSLQAMLADSPQQQKLKATAQMMASSSAMQRLNTTAQTSTNAVQQAQGRERPRVKVIGNAPVNDDVGLETETEADVIETKALNSLTAMNVSPPIQRKEGAAKNSLIRFNPTAIVQRVLIGDVDITSSTPYRKIVEVLGWSKFGGISKALTDEQKLALKSELEHRDDCDQILECLDDDSSSDSGSWDDDAAYSSDDDVDFTAFQPNYVASSQSGGKSKRTILADDFGWESFPESSGNLKKLGVHETDAKEKSAALIKDGPSREMIGKGRGIGKGPGFYVTPVGKKKLSTAIGAIEYGNELLAIYIDKSVKPFQSPDEAHDHVDQLMELAVAKSIEEHSIQLELLIIDAHEILDDVEDGIAISEQNLLQIDLLAKDIKEQLIKIEKEIKRLKRKLNQVNKMIDEMRMHQAEIQHPTDLYYFIMSGGGEIVIPIDSYDKVSAFQNWKGNNQ